MGEHRGKHLLRAGGVSWSKKIWYFLLVPWLWKHDQATIVFAQERDPIGLPTANHQVAQEQSARRKATPKLPENPNLANIPKHLQTSQVSVSIRPFLSAGVHEPLHRGVINLSTGLPGGETH